jgi:electron transfer flavoprotein beta subunit
VITTDLRLNEPRYVKLPDIMKAKKKPLETIAISDLASDTAVQIDSTNWAAPAKREKGVMVDSVDALITALKDKGLVA